MPRAGFYAVESGKISFRRDGNWYSDDERIDNPRIALLFSKSVTRNPDGSYFLQVAEERAAITVEDTPYVVLTVEDCPDTIIIVTGITPPAVLVRNSSSAARTSSAVTTSSTAGSRRARSPRAFCDRPITI